MNDIKVLFSGIYLAFLFRLRQVQLMNPKFYTPFDPTIKYLYYPLHASNEYATQVQGTMWTNQLQIIEALAKSIPFDWKVVVKEHPGMLLTRVRPMSFYKEIKNYPNVVLIPIDTSSHQVVSAAQMVVTIVGTTGWEAIMRGIPVITFEENMFDVIGLSRRCSDFKELSVAIHDEVERMKKISPQERKQRIIYLLTAIVKEGFWVDNPLYVLDACPDDLHATKIGKIIAKEVKKCIEAKNV